MKIEVITIGELATFAESALYKNFHDIPITRLRALSQSQNPRASTNDVALLVAHEDNRLLSYIGLMPDLCHLDEQPVKIWWNSCWWANETEKNNGSMQLFYMACKLTNGRLYFPELTPHTTNLLSRMKGFGIQNVEGVRGYLKMNFAVLLPARKKEFLKLRPLLRLIDFGVNLLFSPVCWGKGKRLSKKDLDYKVLDRIDDETAGFIGKHNTHELFRRNKLDINWMIDYPWITKENLQSDQHYAFSHQAKSFGVRVVKVYQDKHMCGFFMLLIRDGNAKLTYCYSEPDYIPHLIDVLYKQLLENKIFTFITFDQRISEYIQNHSNPFLHTRKQVKTIAFPQEVSSRINSHTIQDGDGDCFFV